MWSKNESILLASLSHDDIAYWFSVVTLMKNDVIIVSVSPLSHVSAEPFFWKPENVENLKKHTPCVKNESWTSQSCSYAAWEK